MAVTIITENLKSINELILLLCYSSFGWARSRGDHSFNHTRAKTPRTFIPIAVYTVCIAYTKLHFHFHWKGPSQPNFSHSQYVKKKKSLPKKKSTQSHRNAVLHCFPCYLPLPLLFCHTKFSFNFGRALFRNIFCT